MNKRKQKLERDMGDFIQKYKRKHYPGHNPNDRKYDRDIEKKSNRWTRPNLMN